MKDTVTFDLSENGYVYFIAEAVPYNGRMHKYGFHSTEDGDFFVENIKIGWTQRSPEERLAALQTANPRELFVLGSIFTNREAEKMIHDTLSYGRVRGEWFDFKAVGERLSMWMPIFDYYDFDRNVLNMSRYKFKDKVPQKKTYFDIPDYFNEVIEFFPRYIHHTSYMGSLLQLTTANKMHFDIIKNIINEGDDYYKIKDGAGWDQVTKISESTLSMFFTLIEKFNLKEVMQTIADRNKKYFQTRPNDPFADEIAESLLKEK